MRQKLHLVHRPHYRQGNPTQKTTNTTSRFCGIHPPSAQEGHTNLCTVPLRDQHSHGPKNNSGAMERNDPKGITRLFGYVRQRTSQESPPRRQFDHKIPLTEGTEPPFGPLYGMSRKELSKERVLSGYREGRQDMMTGEAWRNMNMAR